MQYCDYVAELGSAQRYTEVLEQSDRYRVMRKDCGRAQAPGHYRAVERLGAWLIAVGRSLCERRGELAVEVEFHPAAARAAGPHGRHVA